MMGGGNPYPYVTGELLWFLGVSMVLALWKLIEIFIWVFKHVDVVVR